MNTSGSIKEFGPDSALPFEVHSLSWIKLNKRIGFFQPFRTKTFNLIIITEGNGLHTIDTSTSEIEKGMVYCLVPGQVHLIREDNPIEGIYISFSGDFIKISEEGFGSIFQSGFSGNFRKNPVLQPFEENFTEILDIAKKMQKEYEHFFLLRAELIRSYLKILFIYLNRENQAETVPDRNSDITERFFELLERDFREKKKVSDYASSLVLTSNYVNEKIKEKTGFPASHHIKERVIQEAKRLALFSKSSMKEIAFNLGFDDAAHFSRYFKNNAGISFTDFRKNTATK